MQRPQPGRKRRKHKARGYLKGIRGFIGSHKTTRRRQNRRERAAARKDLRP